MIAQLLRGSSVCAGGVTESLFSDPEDVFKLCLTVPGALSALLSKSQSLITLLCMRPPFPTRLVSGLSFHLTTCKFSGSTSYDLGVQPSYILSNQLELYRGPR